MATISASTTSYRNLSNASTSGFYPLSRITSTDSTNYARLQPTNGTDGYIYLGGFDFGSLPSDAVISEVSIAIKAYVNNTSYITDLGIQTLSGGNVVGSLIPITLTTSASTISVTDTGSWTRSKLLDNFEVYFGWTKSSSGTGYLYVYGMDVTVTYTSESGNIIKKVYKGSSQFTSIYVGSQQVTKIYVGSTQVYGNS